MAPKAVLQTILSVAAALTPTGHQGDNEVTVEKEPEGIYGHYYVTPTQQRIETARSLCSPPWKKVTIRADTQVDQFPS